MRSGWLALGLLAGVAMATSAAAQAFQPPSAGAGRHYDLKFNTNVTYDSNIARTSNTNANLRGIQAEDEIVTPAITFDIVQPIGREVVFLNGATGYDFHLPSENQRLNRQRTDFTLGGSAQVIQCQVSAQGRYAALQSDLADVLLGVVSNTITTVSGGGSVSCPLVRGLSVQASGVYEDVYNSSTAQKLADHTQNSVSAGINYGQYGLGQFGLNFSHSHSDFQNRLLFNGQIGDSFDNDSYQFTYSRVIGTKINVEAGIGESFVHRNETPPGLPSTTSGLTYNAAIAYQANRKLGFDLAASRGYRPSNQPGQLVVLSTSTDLTAHYEVTDRLSVSLGGAYSDTQANNDHTTLSLLAPTNVQRTSVTGGARYRLGKRISLGMNVRQDSNRTNLAAFNYSAVRATLSLNLTIF
jgi:hypothetical protein